MKKIYSMGLLSIVTLMLLGCSHISQFMKDHHMTSKSQEIAQPNQNTTSTSNILASRVFYGTDKTDRLAGGKPLFDYLLDEKIGQYMDWQDIIRMQNAILQTPVHRSVTWRNTRRGVTYTVRPTEVNYNSVKRQYCRRYEIMVKTLRQIEKKYGHVCHDSDGHWYVV